MANVYSTKFIERHSLVGEQGYAVPAGFVAVVRCLDAWTATDLTSTSTFLFIGNLGGTIDYWHVNILTVASHQWRGHQVFVYGEAFAVIADNPTDAIVSGYLLTAP
jgi:hypothetical protein